MSDSLEEQLAACSQFAEINEEMDPLHGRVLCDDRITDLIIAGNMSRVYRASRSDGRFDQDVAVRIAMATGTDSKYRQRFLLD